MAMLALVAGLIVFLGIHSIRLPGEHIRDRMRVRMGKNGFRLFYSLLSIVGLGLIIHGYDAMRLNPDFIWNPPVFTRHISTLLMWISLVLLAASWAPSNHIRLKVQHPMTLAIKVWALAHLLANGDLASIILFGAFLFWSVLIFRSARVRSNNERYIKMEYASMAGNVVALGMGTVLWLAIALWLHRVVLGVSPFGV